MLRASTAVADRDGERVADHVGCLDREWIAWPSAVVGRVRATVAADIHYGVGVTWDYFKNVHGRSGLAGDGKGVKSYAHTNFKTKSGAITGANAAYVALVKSMFYGDGADLD